MRLRAAHPRSSLMARMAWTIWLNMLLRHSARKTLVTSRMYSERQPIRTTRMAGAGSRLAMLATTIHTPGMVSIGRLRKGVLTRGRRHPGMSRNGIWSSTPITSANPMRTRSALTRCGKCGAEALIRHIVGPLGEMPECIRRSAPGMPGTLKTYMLRPAEA